MNSRPHSIFGAQMWMLPPAGAALTILCFAGSGIEFAWKSLLPMLQIAVPAGIGYVVYSRYRPDDTIRAMCEALLFLFLISPPLALIDYPLQALNFPLYDAPFAAIDRAMGFDWMAHFMWVSQNPFAAKCLAAAYHSCMLQMAAIVIALSFARRFDHLREFVLLFVLTAFVVTAIATVLPAEGAYAFYKPPANIHLDNDPLAGIYHLADVRSLRDGTFKSLSMEHVAGLVTLPSFHVIFAILLAWSTRGLRYVFIPSIVLNTVVSVSALAIGGHYLIDIIAGAMIAFASILLYQKQAELGAVFEHALWSPSAAPPQAS